MSVWVTRTQPGADQTARRLADRGLEALVDPVLEVRPLESPISLDESDALVFTSPNGVRVFADRDSRRDLPVFAVGDVTAQALADAGFGEVRSASGDVRDLARLIIGAKPVRALHIAPRRPAGDLVGLTAAGGVEVVSLPIYETVEIEPRHAITADGLTHVLIHSGRAAEAVARHVPADRLAPLSVLAISEAAAAPLEGRVAAIACAPFPDEPSLLKLCAVTLSEGDT
ncbi:uroporphyrinogen-III synthase [Brevundimonas sp.]|uniref:uroporphyrinogen-III synthase n=1 Tax=Brevundimonas sp. TaxID=1871086 RepID=UPI0025FA86FF|nr:uroporphyrinogen-III synthase [Brevundimonas sp.]